ncbi:MAG: DUF4177 domain-containing protein [Chloroflexi bacterium]|nr:DUF4177 domain-containing protein [Chloroflexota bacterium]
MGTFAYVYLEAQTGFVKKKGYEASDEFKDLQALNQLGREGWELVSTVPLSQHPSSTNSFIAHLKRRLP